MRLSRPPRALASLALVAVVACAACGASSPSAATLGQQVLAIVKTTNSALNKDRSTNASKTNLAYSKTFAQAARQFQALDFPSSLEPDAKALVTILKKMSTQAEAVGKAAAKNQNVLANVTAMAQLNLKLIELEKTEKTASNALRKELGLPLETTTTTTALTTTPSTTTASTTSTAPKSPAG